MKIIRRLRKKLRKIYLVNIYPLLAKQENLKVECPICHWRGNEFTDFDCGYGAVYEKSTCPQCWSQPRHRMFYLYFKSKIPRDQSIDVLHFAPEKYMTQLFRSYPRVNYLSVDIDITRAMQKEDIMSLSFKDDSFDIIICSHVLEHVEGDKKAMEELNRVLRSGGYAIIDVPIDYDREQTYEDDSITSHEERTKAFWQFDHVRLYGRDFPDKLRTAGFEVDEFDMSNLLSPEELARHGFETVPLYVCTKGGT